MIARPEVIYAASTAKPHQISPEGSRVAVDFKSLLNKLILANLSHRPVRTLLSVLAIAVEVTMILTLVGVSHGTLDCSKERARGVGADIMVRPPGTSVMSSLCSAPLSEKFIPLLMKEPHVVLATGTVIQCIAASIPSPASTFRRFKKMSGGFNYLSGGDPVNDNDMIVDEYYAQQNHLEIGSNKRLRRPRLDRLRHLRGRQAGAHLRQAACAAGDRRAAPAT